jgi:hypothetical protein
VPPSWAFRAPGYPDVSDFPVTGRDHGRAAYNEVKAHRSIVAGGYENPRRACAEYMVSDGFWLTGAELGS